MAFKTLSKSQRDTLEQAQKAYSANLDAALPYLAKRGITPEHARRAGLGVVDGSIPAHESRKGRLSIPYMTPSGVVNMNFRCIQDHDCSSIPGHRKYLVLEGAPSNLYFVEAYHYADLYICLAEGELDALSANICGIPTLGVPGATKWLPHWTDVLEDFPYVFVFEDGDAAGENFGKLVRKYRSDAVGIRMPDGQDVNSMYVNHGRLYLHERLTGGLKEEQ